MVRCLRLNAIQFTWMVARFSTASSAHSAQQSRELAQSVRNSRRRQLKDIILGNSRRLETFGAQLCGWFRSEFRAWEVGFRACGPFPHGAIRGAPHLEFPARYYVAGVGRAW